jgi:D-alanyl-D-alanine carboxypeptidase (penicillin-binding protein 5/6)
VRGWAAVVAVAVLLGPLVAGAASAEPRPASPAVSTGPAAGSTGPAGAPAVCPGHEAPPGPPAREETVATAPVPVPSEPVGGPDLGACGDLRPAGAAPPPATTAAGWVVADLDSGAILAAHDPHGRQRPASTLKILTTLVVRERLDPDLEVVAAQEDVDVDGSRAGIGPGGRYTVRQLLAGLLLNSGNDAAMALARTMGGTQKTLAAMQARAEELGALDTRPATPSGLDGPGMSSSAYDLALLFRVALRDPLVRETLATRTVPFPGFADKPGFLLSNDDPLLRYPGAIGGKTGFTDAARHTFVGAAERDGRRLVVALVRSEHQPVRMVAQAAALLDYGFSLPPATSLGMLVDARPVPATPPAPTPSTAAEVEVQAPASGLWIAGAAGVVVLLGLGTIAVRQRRRP